MSARDSRDVLNDPPPPPADERVVYGPEPLQFGDLRLPEGAASPPLAVILHGGGWKATYNLIHAGHMALALTRSGVATWNLEYRLVGDPGGGWPGTFEDVMLALDHLPQLRGIDASRVVLVGHSAGGQLALLAAGEAKLPVVAIAAGSDFESWESQAATAFLGGTPGREASPRARLPIGVRQVLVHGTDDDQVPFWLSEQYVEAARAAGDDAELVTLEGDGHFEPIDPRSRSWPLVELAIAGLMP